jgi:site-specific DNA recombinase
MTPSFSLGKGGVAYRYYISSAIVTGRSAAGQAGAIRRVPANAIEDFVLERLRQHDPRAGAVAEPRYELARRIQRVSLRSGSVRLEIKFAPDQVRDRHDRKAILARAEPDDEVAFDGDILRLTAPVRMKFRGGQTWLALANATPAGAGPSIDPVLVAALRRGHSILAELDACPQCKPDELFHARGPRQAYSAKLCRLAMLAPDIQRAILAGHQPRSVSLQRLMDAHIPVSWSDQRAELGFPQV